MRWIAGNGGARRSKAERGGARRSEAERGGAASSGAGQRTAAIGKGCGAQSLRLPQPEETTSGAPAGVRRCVSRSFPLRRGCDERATSEAQIDPKSLQSIL
jgi:hypothetical protein